MGDIGSMCKCAVPGTGEYWRAEVDDEGEFSITRLSAIDRLEGRTDTLKTWTVPELISGGWEHPLRWNPNSAILSAKSSLNQNYFIAQASATVLWLFAEGTATIHGASSTNSLVVTRFDITDQENPVIQAQGFLPTAEHPTSAISFHFGHFLQLGQAMWGPNADLRHLDRRAFEIGIAENFICYIREDSGANPDTFLFQDVLPVIDGDERFNHSGHTRVFNFLEYDGTANLASERKEYDHDPLGSAAIWAEDSVIPISVGRHNATKGIGFRVKNRTPGNVVDELEVVTGTISPSSSAPLTVNTVEFTLTRSGTATDPYVVADPGARPSFHNNLPSIIDFDANGGEYNYVIWARNGTGGPAMDYWYSKSPLPLYQAFSGPGITVTGVSIRKGFNTADARLGSVPVPDRQVLALQVLKDGGLVTHDAIFYTYPSSTIKFWPAMFETGELDLGHLLEVSLWSGGGRETLSEFQYNKASVDRDDFYENRFFQSCLSAERYADGSIYVFSPVEWSNTRIDFGLLNETPILEINATGTGYEVDRVVTGNSFGDFFFGFIYKVGEFFVPFYESATQTVQGNVFERANPPGGSSQQPIYHREWQYPALTGLGTYDANPVTDAHRYDPVAGVEPPVIP